MNDLHDGIRREWDRIESIVNQNASAHLRELTQENSVELPQVDEAMPRAAPPGFDTQNKTSPSLGNPAFAAAAGAAGNVTSTVYKGIFDIFQGERNRNQQDKDRDLKREQFDKSYAQRSDFFYKDLSQRDKHFRNLLNFGQEQFSFQKAQAGQQNEFQDRYMKSYEQLGIPIGSNFNSSPGYGVSRQGGLAFGRTLKGAFRA